MPLELKQIATPAHISSRFGDSWQAIRVRVCLIAFALVLAISGLWRIGVEFMRPALPYFLAEVRQRQQFASEVGATALAARIGWFRGNLWFDDGEVLWARATTGNGGDLLSTDDLRKARDALVRSVRLSPLNSRAWLLLAVIDGQLKDEPHRQTAVLELSYFTGPTDTVLIPMRMTLAVKSPAIANPDFQILVAGEVRAALHDARLRQVIPDAYQAASPEGRRFLDATIGDLDPELHDKIPPSNDAGG